MAKDIHSFRRPGPKYRPQPSVLVLCEDSKSGKQYLTDAAYDFRVQVEVKIAHCNKTDPIGIVKAAVEQQRKYDRVFCVIDRDRHESFDEAILYANEFKKIGVIASFPCFEVWYLLHFKMTTKPYTEEGRNSPGDCLVRDLRACPGMEKYAKGDPNSIYKQLGPDKLANARKLSPRALNEAIKVGNLNPSTRIHELLDFFEELAIPQPIGATK